MIKFFSGKIAIGMFLLAFFGTSLMLPRMIDDVDIIKQKMMSLGFLESKITTQGDGRYSIQVNAYTQRSQALSLDDMFRPLQVRVIYGSGILYLERADIEKAGFSVHEEYFPQDVKIVRLGITARPLQSLKILKDPNIEQIEQALKKTKRNRKRVYANAREIVHKSSSTFVAAFPDVCKTPSKPGPIPLPYPNIAMSSDSTKGSKKTKADKAAAIAKDSSVKKSESDEVATRMAKLQKSYQRIIAKRELGTNEKAAIKKELKTYLDKAALLKKTLDVYVEEIEKLLQ